MINAMYTSESYPWSLTGSSGKQKFSTSIKPKVLLVEDNLMIQIIHRELLEKLGYEVIVAGNGKEAIEQNKDSFDLIFMDLDLPDMHGFDVIQHIQSALSSCPPIIIWSTTALDKKDVCMEHKVAAVLPKPASIGTVAQVLKAIVPSKFSSSNMLSQ